MQDRLKDIRDRLVKIRPGKWSKYGLIALINYGKKHCGMWDRSERPDGKTHVMPLYDEDADFIANCPADVQYLLAALQEAQKENKRLEERNEFTQKEHQKVYKDMQKYASEADDLEIKLQQSQDRERVLREALEEIIYSSWQPARERAREALEAGGGIWDNH